jgi:hypothetical protein
MSIPLRRRPTVPLAVAVSVPLVAVALVAVALVAVALVAVALVAVVELVAELVGVGVILVEVDEEGHAVVDLTQVNV